MVFLSFPVHRGDQKRPQLSGFGSSSSLSSETMLFKFESRAPFYSPIILDETIQIKLRNAQ